MEFELTYEQQDIIRFTREFAKKEIIPNEKVREEEGKFHKDVIEKMGAAGLFGCLYPENLGGSHTGFLTQVLIMEEMMRASVETGMPFNAQAVNVPMGIYKHGSEEQKSKYVPKLIKGEWIGSFSLTEPDSGSDSAALRTKAIKAEDGSYLINGSKMWTTYGNVADVILLFAKTDLHAGHKGISAFLIEPGKLKGITRNKIASNIGSNCVPSAEIFFEDCRVPNECLLGNEGEGFKIAMDILHYGRVCVPARGLGVMGRLYDESIKYSQARKAFGKTIAEFQAIQHSIAEMASLIEASKLMVYKAAWLADQSKPFGKSASLAKYFTSEAGIRVAELALEIFGGYGFADEYPIHRYFMVARVFRTGEGSSNILKNLIAQDELGMKKIDRHFNTK